MNGLLDLLAEATEAVGAGEMLKGQFEELEKSLGFKHKVEGLLADAEFNHMNWTHLQRVDWVHNDLQHGTCATEIKAFLNYWLGNVIHRLRALTRAW